MLHSLAYSNKGMIPASTVINDSDSQPRKDTIQEKVSRGDVLPSKYFSSYIIYLTNLSEKCLHERSCVVKHADTSILVIFHPIKINVSVNQTPSF